MNSKDIKLSKTLSWLLRHGAVKEGFDLSPEGYINIDKILQHRQFKQFNISDIERVVRDNEKQRFLLRVNPDTAVQEIKAHQGHSIDKVTDQGLTPILTPKYRTVIHGTFSSCWAQIKERGLSRMRRRHVHLATGSGAGCGCGVRRHAQLHVHVDLARALHDGIKFYEADNGVVLTPGDDNGFLDTKYFDKVIEVQTGYPPYTKPQDLAHAFARFGAVRPERVWVTAAVACVEFAAAPAAAAALAAARGGGGGGGGVSVYGALLTVRRATAADAQRPPRQQRRRDPRITNGQNFKGTIVGPADIPLQGSFHHQLDALLAAVRLTQPEIERLTALYRDLERVLGELWPGCRAVPFGSVTTGLGVKSSDADCFVALPRDAPRDMAVPRAKRALQAHPYVFDELLAIPRANTPIVKFRHLPTGVYCDVSFKTALGAQNSKLIAFLLFSDPRLLPVAVAAKYWARVHDLTGTGKLTNYALTMLLIFYFQQPAVALLPPVEWLQRDRQYDCYVDYWNTGFVNDPRRVPRSGNATSIADLLGGFFEFYAAFDFDELCVCPFLGRAVKKDDFRDLRLLPDEFARYKSNVSHGAAPPLRFTTPLCVQDPLEQCHNVASPVSARLAADIRAYLRFAADAYRRERPRACAGLLPTVLLEKPELPRAKKGSSEFRRRLPAGLLANIAAPDWKAAVRDVAFQIFETILRVPLRRLEDEPEKEDRDVRNTAQQKEIAPCSSDSGDTGRPAGSLIPEETAAYVQETAGSEKTVNPEKTDTEEIEADGEGGSGSKRREKLGPKKKGKARVKTAKNGGKPSKEREIYSGEITRAIWKRKLFSKLYSVMGLKFLDRETMITDEIIKVDKNVIDVRFQVVMTFTNQPRGAAVAVRHQAGDNNPFKEFGKFFNNTFQHWFVVLYKPHCRRPGAPGAAGAAGATGPARTAHADEEAAARELREAIDKDEEDNSDSDSDSEFSYEDERVAPDSQDTDSEKMGENKNKNGIRGDADKNDKNRTNSAVKKKSKNDKKYDTMEKDDNKVRTDKKRDEDDVSPRKGEHKNEGSAPAKRLTDELAALNLADESPRKGENCAQHRVAHNEKNEPRDAYAAARQRNRNRTRHGERGSAGAEPEPEREPEPEPAALFPRRRPRPHAARAGSAQVP